MKKIIYCLVKIFKDGDDEYADKLLNSGELYCQDLKVFKEIEDGHVRGDKFEGLMLWIQPKDCVITLTLPEDIPGLPREINIAEADLAAPTAIQVSEYDHHKIYCMYAIAIDEFRYKYSTEEEQIVLRNEINNLIAKQFEFDERLQAELGNIAVVITNVSKFIDRVKEHGGGKLNHGFVEYFDDDTESIQLHGIESIFRKRKVYAYQKEYRFAFLDTGPQTSKVLHIGNLEDIAYKTTLDQLKSSIGVFVK